MKYSGWDYLDHMVSTCEEILEYAGTFSDEQEFHQNRLMCRAITMCLLDLGELFTGLSEVEMSIKETDSWQRIKGFRSRAAHGYHNLDFKVVYKLIDRVRELYPALKQQQCTNGPIELDS